jgi:hypothetical protein
VRKDKHLKLHGGYIKVESYMKKLVDNFMLFSFTAS